jgi:hypothetical protein
MTGCRVLLGIYSRQFYKYHKFLDISNQAHGGACSSETEVVCVNLTGLGTFPVQGIRPLTCWEAANVKRAARNAIAIWLFLLAAVVLVIVNSK